MKEQRTKKYDEAIGVFFFTIEEDATGKDVHVLTNLYRNGDGDLRCADFVNFYIPVSAFPITSEEALFDFLELTSESVAYLGNLSEEEAYVLRDTYFDGKPGTFLSVSNITENTPCGKYWFSVE